MAVSDETRRAYERAADELCRAFAAPAPVLSKTSEAPVIAVNDDGTLDVGYGGAVLTVRMTTACSGVEAGDTVLLTAYGQMLYATGVLSTGNPHYVKRLWSGAYYMNENQTIYLSESVSEQRTGIVLHWQGYDGGKVQDYDHNFTFVPKSITGFSSAGVGSLLTTASGSVLGVKYVYIRDNRIIGNANNGRGKTSMDSGITVMPSHWVLSEVLGV